MDTSVWSTLFTSIIAFSIGIVLKVAHSWQHNESCSDDDNNCNDKDKENIMSTSCANCGKMREECSGDLKTCNGCKMMKYCSRDCQITHRPQHKKECKQRAAELHEEALFKPHPPKEECPICFLPMMVCGEVRGSTVFEMIFLICKYICLIYPLTWLIFEGPSQKFV